MDKWDKKRWANGKHRDLKQRQLQQRQEARKQRHFAKLAKKHGKAWLDWYKEGVSYAIADRSEKDP